MMMNNRILVAVLAAVTVLGLTAPAQGATLRAKYNHRYKAVAEQFGKRAPGRHIVKYGIKPGKKASNKQIARSARTLKRWLAPPPAPVATHDQTAVGQPTYQAGGKYAIPSDIVMCESGGDYGAYNPSSGAGGAYQILPSTWVAYGGTGSPHTAPPAEQDRVAAKVMAGQGRGAWVC